MNKDDDQPQIVRVFVTRATAAERKQEIGAAIAQWLDEGVRVDIRPKQAKREDVQNALAQVWCGQTAKASGEHKKETWGRWKLDFLLPSKESDEREQDDAFIERYKLRTIVALKQGMAKYADMAQREIEIETAFDEVRSKSIGVRLFAEWLTTVRDVEAGNGIALMTRSEEEQWALYESQHRSAA